MSGSQNGTDPIAQLKSEEETLTKILHAKMQRQECLPDGDQQMVAYRIAEIMVAAKELYTKDLPRLMQDGDEADEGEMFSDLAGLRMAFFHIRDLVTDFDEAFLEAMMHERDADSDEESDEDSEDEDEDVEDDEEVVPVDEDVSGSPS